MANTRVQSEVEEWVRSNWMPEHLGIESSRRDMVLASGGKCSFDAVSVDGKVVAMISTSNAQTASGKRAVAKLIKIRADIYFLLLVNAVRRLVILTEFDMFELCKKEQAELGRVPLAIEFRHAQLSEGLKKQLEASKQIASREVTPS